MVKFVVEDYIGKRFGKLTVIHEVEPIDGKTACLFKCDCGNFIEHKLTKVKAGVKKSCGCLMQENYENKKGKPINRTHGQTNTRLYRIWKGMRNRCFYAKSINFKSYGGRGITVCDEWVESFENFFEWAITEGGYKVDSTLERRNVDGNYEPDNCTFVDRHTQARNKTNNRTITINGVTKILQDWCNDYNIPQSTVWNRLNRGMSEEAAITTPVKRRGTNE